MIYLMNQTKVKVKPEPIKPEKIKPEPIKPGRN